MPAFYSVPATVSAALLIGAAAVSSAQAQSSGKEIGATGTIEPRGGIVMLSGVSGVLIKAINVRVGQTVKAGDVLMVLDDRDARLQTSLDLTALEEARRREAQEVAESEQALELAQEKVARAEQDAKAYESLGPNATSQIQIENTESNVRDTRAVLASDQRHDFEVKADTAAEVTNAAKRYKYDRTRLAAYKITAPSAGVVLQVTQHVGEILGGPPIEIGDISNMYVLCDAFQGDLLKIEPGMHATASSNALSQTLTGRVEWVGRLIQTKSQTGQFRIKLDDASLAGRLVGMEVNVKVQLGS
jgi:HlyD family secretion protein